MYLGKWETTATPRPQTLFRSSSHGNSLLEQWGATPRKGALVSGVWPKAFDREWAGKKGGDEGPESKDDRNEHGDNELDSELDYEMTNEATFSSPFPMGYNSRLSPTQQAMARLTPPLILLNDQAPVVKPAGVEKESEIDPIPIDLGSRRKFKRPQSVASTVPFKITKKEKNASKPQKKYGDKWKSPGDKTGYKGAEGFSEGIERGNSRQSHSRAGSMSYSNSLSASSFTSHANMSVDGSLSPNKFSPQASLLNSLSPSYASSVLRTSKSVASLPSREYFDPNSSPNTRGHLYLCKKLHSSPGAPHRVASSSSASKRPLFRSDNTSLDRTGCGKMGMVEYPVKDSMFNAYRIEDQGSVGGRVSPDARWKADRILPTSPVKPNKDIWKDIEKQSKRYSLTKKQKDQTSRVGLERIVLLQSNN
eukprot:CAMPEP_0118660976 /NCGR_PEP_ID=MMETSP0785-20121206/16009_1 /TAXON_ID=91992 /ORGANISM="Bolidomonas pacifica, Strain CCMP 1866" /LENGTH=420 /DNA_ID=CAMNT_0006554337 /DNA_START=57 /DNA_END=1316 /DNA_ORIENTATION=+